jgi:hypothetical protein
MGSERHINYQWVENGLFELSERYGENALSLLNKSDDDEGISLTLMISDIIREHIDKIDYLLRNNVKTNINGSLDFVISERDDLEPEILQEITPLITEFREKVINISRTYPIEERMGRAPLAMGAVLGCIRDMKKRIDEFYSNTI